MQPAQRVCFLRAPGSRRDSNPVLIGDSVEINRIIRSKAEQWTRLFASWIAGLNRRNACLGWWAYTSTAKNLLSSPLGTRFMEALAVAEIARQASGTLYVCGATAGQMETIRALLRPDGIAVGGPAFSQRWRAKAGRWLEALLRVLQQAAGISIAFLGKRLQASERPLDICLFTYVDSARHAGVDSYFGRFMRLLEDCRPGMRARYAAYVYAPYRSRLRELAALDGEEIVPLFHELSLVDYVASARASSAALFPGRHRLSAGGPLDLALQPLLREALIDDVRVGGYLHNLLIHRAVRRSVRRTCVGTLIYPYENKSLEKLLLLGAREGRPGIATVGYQHTSITRRHITLLFEPGEAEVTPLPDRIVTVGDITRRFLEGAGRYPPGIFFTGCALRQQWEAPLPRRMASAGPFRLLLALSSSRRELQEAVEFVRAALDIDQEMNIGIRPHPNFPLAALPAGLRRWIEAHASDLSGTPLRENLAWCDSVAYVSSTVALEALMVGRPVVNLRLSDAIDPDPLLEPAPLAWKVSSPGELLAVLRSARALDDVDFGSRRDATIERMKAYFRPHTPEAFQAFLATGAAHD